MKIAAGQDWRESLVTLATLLSLQRDRVLNDSSTEVQIRRKRFREAKGEKIRPYDIDIQEGHKIPSIRRQYSMLKMLYE